jgi:hypothetical protein
MSRGEHIGHCRTCGKEYRWGDCFTPFCFDHDPKKAFERTLMKTAIRAGESQADYVERVRQKSLNDPHRNTRLTTW